MKEIKVLMQQLRQYPNNFFVRPTKYEDMKHNPPMEPVYGLIVCNHLGEGQGFIETGGEEGVIVN